MHFYMSTFLFFQFRVDLCACRKMQYRRGYRDMTNFRERDLELDILKVKAHRHLCQLNQLRVEYIAWWTQKHQSFVNGMNLIQFNQPSLIPREVTTLNLYRKTIDVAQRLSKAGQRVPHLDQLESLMEFWDKFKRLKENGDALYADFCRFCASIKRLRRPEVKAETDLIKIAMDSTTREDFDFSEVNNERDNLFTYKLNVSDRRFMGLISYIPFLLTHLSRLYYLISKIHLERE